MPNTYSSKDIYDMLFKKAMEDDIITPDEEAILQSVMTVGKRYDTLKEKALEDGVLDNFEYNRLNTLRGKILEKSFNIADSDNQISEDERELLNLLVKLLRDTGELNLNTED
ncbi:MAG: hypothetical protein OEY49_10985 [Candidatus Heimdallarchaeota archaeon]|nr:hypothetical protein [Candidatus Heimdallarchaeota archaeon]